MLIKLKISKKYIYMVANIYFGKKVMMNTITSLISVGMC